MTGCRFTHLVDPPALVLLEIEVVSERQGLHSKMQAYLLVVLEAFFVLHERLKQSEQNGIRVDIPRCRHMRGLKLILELKSGKLDDGKRCSSSTPYNLKLLRIYSVRSRKERSLLSTGELRISWMQQREPWRTYQVYREVTVQAQA